MMQVLIFTIEKQKYALDLNRIIRVLLALQYTPLAKSPDHVLGVINFHGDIVPIVNTRRILGLDSKEIEPTDHIILCHTQKQVAALLVDHVERVHFLKECKAHSHMTPCLLKEEEIALFFDLERLISNQPLPVE